MILIFSESRERSSNEVIQLLLAKSKNFRRCNLEDFSHFSLLLTNNSNRNINFVIWHRRAKINLIPIALRQTVILKELKKEEDAALKAFELLGKNNSKYFGSYLEEDQHNKIYDLEIAKNCGFVIPETLVTNSKKDLIIFLKNYERVISKAIKYPFYFHKGHSSYSSGGTFLVKNEDLYKLDEIFMVSLFQEYIPKKYEVRVFVFATKIYAMAILSQNDEKTKIDFRNYNQEKPNRNIPFRLPKDIIKKIKRFMKLKKMNSGSMDLIVTPKNEFVFLEINPQGQYDWLSKNCNYYIEKDISNILSNG